jgi:hypothetical protein
MKTFIRAAVCAAALISASATFAADPCSNYKWDVTREVKLYATGPTPLAAAASVAQAPSMALNTYYALALLPQEQVKFVVAPSKRMLADGAFGGVLKFRVPTAGAYRVAIDAGFWLDVVNGTQSLATLDFNGVRDCAGPHKIVVFEMPANTDLTLQMASSTSAAVHVTVTPATVAP